jgi:hypothetical protein
MVEEIINKDDKVEAFRGRNCEQLFPGNKSASYFHVCLHYQFTLLSLRLVIKMSIIKLKARGKEGKIGC